MKKYLLVILFFAVSNAYAGEGVFDGKWYGTKGEFAMYVYGELQGKAPCSEFKIEINQTPIAIQLNDIYAHCGKALEINYSTGELTIQGQDLFYFGKKEGVLVGNHLQFDHQTEERHLLADFTVQGNKMDYRYEWTDGTNKFIINGKLKRK